MKRKAISIAAATVVLLSQVQAKIWELENPGENPQPIPVVGVQTNRDGLLLRMDPGTLRLQVFTSNIVRVAYAREGTIPDPSESLAVIASPQKTAWNSRVTADEVCLETANLGIRVHRASGAVSFYDPASGESLLTEPKNGGKSMTPNQIAGTSTWICRQEFALRPNEAIYGLGQHQCGDLDYRDNRLKIKMYQQNPGESAVPVLVSSRGYGILWDNPALAVVDTAGGGAETISSEFLYDREGEAGGLSATYFEGTHFEKKVREAVTPVVDFDWGKGAPRDLPKDKFSIRWEGAFSVPETGRYIIQITSDDGVRVWIDGKKVIDSWIQRAATTDSVPFHFEKGSRHTIKIEYFDKLADACISLKWVRPGHERFSWTAEAGRAIDYYFIRGPQLDRVVAGYRFLTGKVPMQARWFWGFWQSKERYHSQQELLNIARTYRDKRLPIDGIVQDWHYWPDLNEETLEGGWGSHEFDPGRFPDPKKMVEDLHKEHFRLLISVWPWFQRRASDNRLIPNGQELDALGGILPFPGKTWGGVMSWYDPFGKAVRDKYWEQVSTHLFRFDVDGWWLDSSEPVSGGDPGRLRNHKTLAGPGCLVVNAYPLAHTEGVYRHQRAETDKKRVFILTRSAYAGQQRTASVVWSGDIIASWDVFRRQIPAGLNFSLSGIPYWNTDIGAFHIRKGGFKGPGTPAYDELFTRWFQFGAFCPMFRVHGTDFAREIWRFPEDIQKILITFDRLRYHLIPYIYSVSWMVTHDDYTMMRPLVMDFPADTNVWRIADQYLFGPALMVCPVVKKGATSRSVYLPQGTWYDFWTGESLKGGRRIEAPAPLERMPLFVRAGSIIPYGPDIQYTDEKVDPVEIRIYPGADGKFALYEDVGDGYAYEKGEYSLIPFRWDDARGILKIGARRGDFPGMKKRRTFRVVLVGKNSGASVPNSRHVSATVTYTGKAQTVRLKKKR